MNFVVELVVVAVYAFALEALLESVLHALEMVVVKHTSHVSITKIKKNIENNISKQLTNVLHKITAEYNTIKIANLLENCNGSKSIDSR